MGMLVVSLLKDGQHFVVGGVPRDQQLELVWDDLPVNLRWPDGSYLVAVTDGRTVRTVRLRPGRRLTVVEGQIRISEEVEHHA